MSATEEPFEFRDVYEIGRDYHRGWVEIRHVDSGVRLSVCARGVGHDEPSTGESHTLTLAEAAELRDVLSTLVPDETEATETPQWGPVACDVCGEPIRSSNDRWSGSYSVRRRFGRTTKRSGTWHGRCAPAEFRRKHAW